METKGQFCGQKSKIVDPVLTHPAPSYEDQGHSLKGIEVWSGAA